MSVVKGTMRLKDIYQILLKRVSKRYIVSISNQCTIST